MSSTPAWWKPKAYTRVVSLEAIFKNRFKKRVPWGELGNQTTLHPQSFFLLRQMRGGSLLKPCWFQAGTASSVAPFSMYGISGPCVSRHSSNLERQEASHN